jgi:hypothetical protein
MHTLKKRLLFAAFLAGHTMFAQVDPVSGIIGDKSYIEKFGHTPGFGANEKLRIQTHLEYVETMLGRVNTGRFTPAELESRQKMIRLLHDYRLAGKFPSNYDMPVRRPCFQDKDGNICAVGYLVQQTAGQEAVDKINAKHQYSYIEEMQVPELEQWILASGLSKEECAMIQPTYEPVKIAPVFVDGGRDGFREFISKEISLDRFTVDSVRVSFVVDTAGNVTKLKVIGKEKLRLQVAKAMGKAKFSPSAWSGWGWNGKQKEETAMSFNLVFNLPADSSHFPRIICYEDAGMKDNGKSSIKVTGLLTGTHHHGGVYGKVRILQLEREVPITQGGYFEFLLDKESLAAGYFDIEVLTQGYRKIILRHIPLMDQKLTLQLEPSPPFNGWDTYPYVDQMGTRFPIRTGKQ